jgi:DHA2 family methylenomycin A resistance protein-like MFS transporter
MALSVAVPGSRGLRRSDGQALALAAISAGFLMITLDATIVNVALGAIGADLGGAPSTAQWIVDGYTVAFASLLVLAGSLADGTGVRAGFLIGLAVFVLASAACAVAGSVAFLIAARVAQGMGAAWLMPCSLALITHSFVEPQARRRALAVWGAMSGVGLAAGPVVGGILVASIGWRAIFLANVPIGVAAAWLLTRHAQETTRRRRALDLPGQLLAIVSLAALTGAFISAGARGWTAGVTVALGVCGLLGATAFVLVERNGARAAHRSRPVPGQDVHDRGRDRLPLQLLSVREHLLPRGRARCTARMDRAADRPRAAPDDRRHRGDGAARGATRAPARRVAGRRRRARVGSARRNPGRPVRSGAHLAALLLSTVPIGFTALAMPAMTGLAMGSVPRLRLGLSAGVFNTSRQAGGALGVAVLGTILTSGPGASVSLRPAFLLTAGAYGLAVALAAARPLRAGRTTHASPRRST